jgi:hypothetical protein
VAPDTAPLPDPDANGNTRFFLNSPLPELGDLDVNVFYGSGVYASDSFRIYSPLLPGEGGPRREAEWLRKRRRAEGRCTLAASKLGRTERDLDVPQGPVTETGEMEGSMGIKEVDDALSDEDDVGPEEWRRVRAGGTYFPGLAHSLLITRQGAPTIPCKSEALHLAGDGHTSY